ncbi:MAG: hypothetical protein M1823_002522 [Watsoniomyces obsoletus]|nr:MAG: hypothetical protein M1823_002522 [Watsoniomyces obsoletus]
MRPARERNRTPQAALPAARQSSERTDGNGFRQYGHGGWKSPSDRSREELQRPRSLVERLERKEVEGMYLKHSLPVPPAPGRVTQGPQGPNTSDLNSIAVTPDGWETWDSLAIRVFGLPWNISTLDLWSAFQKEGNVSTIEIFENRQGHRDGTAKLRFRPPPRKAFWVSGTYEILQFRNKPFERKFSVPIKVIDTFGPKPTTQSPVNPTIRFLTRMALKPLVIDFGFMFEKDVMMVMRSSETRSRMKPVVELDLQRRQLDIHFDLFLTNPNGEKTPMPTGPLSPRSKKRALNITDRMESYRIQMSLDQLQQIVEVEETPETRSLIISLDTPPNFYRKGTGKQLPASHEQGLLYWSDWSAWNRQTDIVFDRYATSKESLGLRKTQPVIDIGRWTTYRFTLDNFEGNLSKYQSICAALKDYNVQIKKVKDFKVIPAREPETWNLLDRAAHSPVGDSRSFLAYLQDAVVAPLGFVVRYQLEVCLSQGQLNEHNLSRAFIERLAEMEEQKASDLLRYVADRKERIYDPMTIFNLKVPKSFRAHTKIPRYCAMGRKATVTPSKIYFSTPQVEATNRVIRQYIGHADRFLRVQFTDEKHEGRINSTDRNTNDEIFSRIWRCLTHGIVIGDRRYEFLAFGNSQLREHGAYFFAPTLNLTTAHIRSWMGDFSKIREIARHAARVGQCFSTTRAINGIKVTVVEMPDVKKGSFNFTDGVGKISESLAKLVTAELGLPSVPSVFQFRLGGCKGVLAIWPDARNWEVHIRPSQYKFPAISEGLEIVRWSQFAAAALNRQVIIVLSALGVPASVFVRKLRTMLATLEQAMRDESVAVTMLRRQVDACQTTLLIAALIECGFMESQEPFVLSLLHLWRSWTVKYLKERARIVIDQGAFVFGVTDESKTLKGHINRHPAERGLRNISDVPEIFIQILDEKTSKYKVVEGLCLLARNPSLHPGDIRVVRAVDNPRLRHIKDAVVLPQTGDRDVASMCSGGDLDGDDFLVMWDEELIPPEWNHPPMDYSPPAPEKLDRPVTNGDITGFFVQYMKNDRLGRIATAHLAQADQRPMGVKDQKCLQLAALHSKAVDYVKTGQPAVMPRELAPRQYPHFMENKYRTKYHSVRVLGQLYDQVERIDFVPRYNTTFDTRILNAFPVTERQMQDARDLKERYDGDMRRIMAQHEIRTEFEVWSTFALSHTNMTKDYKFHEELGGIAFALRDQYHRACVEAAGGNRMAQLGPFVVAMYRVTRDDAVAALEREKKWTSNPNGQESPPSEDGESLQLAPLISFPWCCTEVLCSVANGRKEIVKLDDLLKGGPSMILEDDWLGGGKRKHGRHPKVKVPGPHVLENLDDTIETVEGSVRRGETLELFHDDDDNEAWDAGKWTNGGTEAKERYGINKDDKSFWPVDSEAIKQDQEKESVASPSESTNGEPMVSSSESTNEEPPLSDKENDPEMDIGGKADQVQEQQKPSVSPKHSRRTSLKSRDDDKKTQQGKIIEQGTVSAEDTKKTDKDKHPPEATLPKAKTAERDVHQGVSQKKSAPADEPLDLSDSDSFFDASDGARSDSEPEVGIMNGSWADEVEKELETSEKEEDTRG